MTDVAAEARRTLGLVASAEPPRDGPEVPISVTLIRPPVVVLEKRLSFMGLGPLIGLAYVAAAARSAGHEVTVIDAPAEAMDHIEVVETPLRPARRFGLPLAEIVERIPPSTAVVGIAHMFLHEWPMVRELAEAIKQAHPDVVVVLGGENATGFAPWILEQCSAIDAIVQGEGEVTFVALLDAVGAGRPFHHLPGVASRHPVDGSTSINDLAPRVRDLGSIDRPAWDLFPTEAYLRYRSFFGVHRGRSLPVLATRGCPYRCSFCSSPQMWTTRYNVRDPEDVVDEIEDLVATYGITNVDFSDLTAFTKRSWILALCDAMDRRGVQVSIQVPQGTRSEALDDEVLDRLVRAGVRNLTFAPETGSDRMLGEFNKRVDLERMLDRIRAADRAGIVVSANTIIGHPDETWKDRLLTWRFLLRGVMRGLSGAGVSIFYPYPGSKDFEELFEQGKLTIDDRYCYDSFTTSSSRIDHGRTLYGLLQAMVLSATALSYIIRPSRIVHLVRTTLRGGEEHTFMEQAIRTKLRGPMSWRSTARS